MKKSKKRICLCAVALILLIITSVLIYYREQKGMRTIKTIKVELNTDATSIYGKHEFTIVSRSRFQKILTYLNEYKKEFPNPDTQNMVYRYKVTVSHKSGKQETTLIDEEYHPKEDEMKNIMNEKEVIEEIRSFFVIDEAQIARVELCKWSQNETNEMKKQEITDEATVKRVFQIGKEYTLSEPEESAKFKPSELYFYDHSGNVVACLYFTKESSCYGELLDLIPSVENYV